MRFTERTTRDHFTEIAQEHHRSLSDSVAVAQKAATTYTLEKDIRIREIKAELKRVDALQQAARGLVDIEPAPAGSARGPATTPRRAPAVVAAG